MVVIIILFFFFSFRFNTFSRSFSKTKLQNIKVDSLVDMTHVWRTGRHNKHFIQHVNTSRKLVDMIYCAFDVHFVPTFQWVSVGHYETHLLRNPSSKRILLASTSFICMYSLPLVRNIHQNYLSFHSTACFFKSILLLLAK